mmetsp:Transcript_31939/g.62494  ORF Transcript_31939/g.62494 Transcript_31939/m.62494 type:complete len:331 (-) Transcript_31939:460-1452(-)
MSAFPVEMEAPDRFAFAITLARFAALVCSTVVVFRYLANGDGITPTEKRAFITMAAWAPIAAIRNALLLALSSSLACRLAAGLERAVISLLICYVGAIACSWRPGSMFDRYWQSPVNVFSVYAVVEFIAIFCMFSGQPDVSFLAKATTLLVIHFPAMAPIVYHGMATLSETFSDLEDNLQQQSHAPKPRKMMVVTSVLTCLFIPLIVALIYDYGILSSKEFIEHMDATTYAIGIPVTIYLCIREAEDEEPAEAEPAEDAVPLSGLGRGGRGGSNGEVSRKEQHSTEEKHGKENEKEEGEEEGEQEALRVERAPSRANPANNPANAEGKAC